MASNLNSYIAESEHLNNHDKIQLIVKKGYVELLAYLIDNQSLLETDEDKVYYIFHHSRAFKHPHLIKYLMEKLDIQIDNMCVMSGIIYLACSSGNYESVKYIIDRFQLNANHGFVKPIKALNLACYHSNIEMTELLINTFDLTIEDLLDSDLKDFIYDDYPTCNAFLVACAAKNLDYVKYIVEQFDIKYENVEFCYDKELVDINTSKKVTKFLNKRFSL